MIGLIPKVGSRSTFQSVITLTKAKAAHRLQES
jgi:hypothetical protein